MDKVPKVKENKLLHLFASHSICVSILHAFPFDLCFLFSDAKVRFHSLCFTTLSITYSVLVHKFSPWQSCDVLHLYSYSVALWWNPNLCRQENPKKNMEENNKRYYSPIVFSNLNWCCIRHGWLIQVPKGIKSVHNDHKIQCGKQI